MPFVTIDKDGSLSAKLRVVGIGGGGCNAIESMMTKGLEGVEYIAVNTDAQVLEKSSAQHKVQIGRNLTKGLGAGADPNVGRKALEEDREKITKILEGSDMVFVTAGMGGGTGTGGAPIIASIAQSVGALVIGIVTKPFRWEGKRRMSNAEDGIRELRQYVDSLIVIPNERILNIMDDSSEAFAAFDKPNEVLHEATRGIAEIITVPGKINVDFADVRSVMNQSGEALMGCGIASGEHRAVEAAQKAISSPLLEGVNIKGAKNILLNVTASSTLTMREITEGNQIIYDAAGEEANVIFGLVQKEDMNEYVSYTVIATGFSSNESLKSRQSGKAEEEKPRKVAAFNPGFKATHFEFDENADLDIPTIKRMGGAGHSFMKNDEPSQVRLDFFNNDNRRIEPKKPVTSDIEDDSSTFLRMMMD
ncbi:MAG: cell division protein FtsZ [Ignavibacteriae bacterium HGW-Ignavibacteriae-2]|jgi:cell division protein FtsZ|nr:MAG: cell division protein FtsZ [Ignavibacteriae bacterium HGW-Ignavibacteriae-2]